MGDWRTRLILLTMAWGGVATAEVEHARVAHVNPIDFLAIANGLKSFRLNAGRYPTDDEGLMALVEKPDTYPEGRSWRQTLKKLPDDPWGRPVHYITSQGPDGDFGLYSTGADGVSHSKGNDPDDWNSWSEDGRGRKTFVDELRDVPMSFWFALVTLAVAIGAVVRAQGRRAGV